MHKVARVIRTAAYYACFFALTVVAIIIGAIHSLVHIFVLHKEAGQILRLNIWRYGKAWTRLLALFTSVAVTGGKEPLPYPCIIIVNHQSVFDPYCLGFLPKKIGGRVNFWVTSWPFSIPVFGLCMRAVNYIDTTRLSGEKCIEKSRQLLETGVNIAVFPEGTRSTTGEIGKFRIGVFKLAMEAGAPILPVAISGLGTFAPKGRFLLGDSPIKISILEPVSPQEFTTKGHLPERVLARAVKEKLHNAVMQT
jgi:1-acyl-sn-glycerol-3-phosphate acyltransferase